VQIEAFREITPELAGLTTAQWFAIRTRSRHEKKIASELREKGVCHFLPLQTQVHRWSDRNKRVEVPLFPGYLFVRTILIPEARVTVLRTPGVVGFVGDQGKGSPIPDKQIEDIQTILEQRIHCTLHPFLNVNQRVRIRGGCLDGVEGVLVGMNTDLSLVVSVDLIKRSMAIRVSGYNVVPV
jgi:transcription antitermination factor NusG